jgi:hypothetical protein
MLRSRLASRLLAVTRLLRALADTYTTLRSASVGSGSAYWGVARLALACRGAYPAGRNGFTAGNCAVFAFKASQLWRGAVVAATASLPATSAAPGLLARSNRSPLKALRSTLAIYLRRGRCGPYSLGARERAPSCDRATLMACRALAYTGGWECTGATSVNSPAIGASPS